MTVFSTQVFRGKILVYFTKFTSLEISQKHDFQFKRTSQENLHSVPHKSERSSFERFSYNLYKFLNFDSQIFIY